MPGLVAVTNIHNVTVVSQEYIIAKGNVAPNGESSSPEILLILAGGGGGGGMAGFVSGFVTFDITLFGLSEEPNSTVSNETRERDIFCGTSHLLSILVKDSCLRWGILSR